MKSAALNTRGITAADGTTKARIERAALSLFAAQGVDAVTTREIAAASGVSEGALYRHYPGKEDLAETLFFTIHKRLAEDIRAAGQSSDSIDEQAKAVTETYCRIADEDWVLFSYHLLNPHRFLPKSGKAYDAFNDNPVAAVEDIVEDAMRRNEIPKGDSKLMAAMALGVVMQAAYHKIYGRLEGSLSKHCPTLINAVIAVLHS